MMKQVLATALALAMSLPVAVLADTSSSSTGAYQAQNNSSVTTASPIGMNTNVMVNNNNTGSESLGGGIQCQAPALAVSTYGGMTNQSGFGGNTTFGGSVSYSMPVGSESVKACNALAKQQVMQKDLDTCLTLAKNGFKVNPAVNPELAKMCSMIEPIGK